MRYLLLRPEQIVKMINAAEQGIKYSVLKKLYGVSATSIWKWKRYLGLSADWLNKVRTLELRLVQSRRELTKTRLQLRAASGVIRRLEPSAKKRAIYACAVQAKFGICRSRSSLAMGLSSRTNYRTENTARNNALVREMKRYLTDHPGIGFARMFDVVLRSRGYTKAHALQLYVKSRLQIAERAKNKLRIPQRIRNRHLITGKRDAMWAIDFLTLRLATGANVYVLNFLDEFTRECVVSSVSRQRSAAAVVRAFEDMAKLRRLPKAVRSDNGGEFTGDQIVRCLHRMGIGQQLIRFGRASENAIVERFHHTMRTELLKWYEFRKLDEVQAMLDDFRARYNIGRPHTSLGGLSPLQFAYLATRRARTALSEQSPGTRQPIRQQRRLTQLAPEVVF